MSLQSATVKKAAPWGINAVPALIMVLSLLLPAAAKDDVQRIIFEDQKIEGKIRRPQLVLITADQRPQFTPMVMQSLGKSGNIASSVNEEIIDESPYKKAFKFEGTRITSYAP